MTRRDLTPPQTVGPFFHGGLLPETMNVLVTQETAGERIRIEGCVYDGDGAPVSDALVEIWQANAAGRYRHPADRRSAPLDPAFTGFGRAGTDERGFYWLETIKPGRVPFDATRSQAPHLNVFVFARGLLDHLRTRLYFDDERTNTDDPVLRDAVENGWPQPLELEEHSHAGMAQAYAAGAAGLPLAILRGYVGTDLSKVNPNIRFIDDPFTGERLAAIPSLRPDVSIVHAQRADRAGNVLLEGIVGVQKEAVLAAARAVVTVEEVVDDLRVASPNSVVLPHWTVGAIVEAPGGARPSYAHGYYRRDNNFYTQWDTISRERETFLDWMKENVLKTTAPRVARG